MICLIDMILMRFNHITHNNHLGIIVQTTGITTRTADDPDDPDTADIAGFHSGFSAVQTSTGIFIFLYLILADTDKTDNGKK